MEKYSASFLGRDCPGVVAAVSRLFGDMGCNIESMTQTMLSGIFAAIFVVSAPTGATPASGVAAPASSGDDAAQASASQPEPPQPARAPVPLDAESLRQALEDGLARAGVDLSVLVRPAVLEQWGAGLACEPFVVTVDGPDRPGLIGSMSRIFGRHGVNIENLKAILGEGGEGHALFVFEVMVPESVDLGRLRRELALEATRLNLRVSVQHRNIFEAIHRVSSF